jgi:hypothetical protein
MSTLRKVTQRLLGIATCLAFGFSWLWALTFYNRLYIYTHKENYKPETFVVSKAVYSHDDDGADSYWLTGTVRWREERLVPHLPGAAIPRTADDLKRKFPKGTKIPVLYNPEATETLHQGESLRVLEYTPDLWEREARIRNRLAIFVLVPGPVMLTVYILIRRSNRRQQGPPPPPEIDEENVGSGAPPIMKR